jgi:putative transposase
VPAKHAQGSSDVVGVDLGLTSAAVIHDGETTRVVGPQRALRRNLKKLRRLDRQLVRTQRGSRNREKAKLRRARGSITRSSASGRTTSTSSRAHWRKPSR